MAGIGREIAIAAVTATTATLVTALITHYLTKSSTIASVAAGTTPLPAGATPKTETQTMSAGSNPTPNPPPKPPPPTQTEIAKMAAMAQAANEQLGWIASSWKAMQNA